MEDEFDYIEGEFDGFLGRDDDCFIKMLSGWSAELELRETPAKPKRRYKLSLLGLNLKRQAIARIQPWQKSTGPKTPSGKRRTSQNNLIHGLYTRDFMAERRQRRGSSETILP